MKTIGDLINRGYNAHPINSSEECIVYKDQSLTYRELNDRVNQLANGLLQEGFKKGDSAAILLYNSIEWIEIFFAVAKLGGVVVPVNFYLKEEEIKYYIEDSNTNFFFVENDLEKSISNLKKEFQNIVWINIDGTDKSGMLDYEKIVLQGESFEPNVFVDMDDLVLLQYTSGTTGKPKGVMHSHKTILWNAFTQIVDFNITRDERYLCVPSFCWAAGLQNLTISTFWVGGSVIINQSTGFSTNRLLELIQNHRATKMLSVSSLLKRIIDEGDMKNYDLSSLKLVLSGGEALHKKVIEEFIQKFPNAHLGQVYGLTEFPSLALYLEEEYALTKLGSAGRPSLGTQIRLINDDGNDVKTNEVGEILLRSPSNMLGYLNEKNKSSETFFENDWMKTGDLAKRDEDGFYYITGRKKDMIISGGINMYPAEIEGVITRHPAVKEVAVVGIADPKWGEIPKAFIVENKNSKLTKEEMNTFLNDKLADYKVPKMYNISKEELPKNASGKIEKFKLNELID